MTWITVTRQLAIIDKLMRLYGADGSVRRSTEPLTMDVANVSGNADTLTALATNFNALTLTHDAGTVTLTADATCKCYLWIDGIQQPAQADFNPLGTGDDNTLTGLTAPGAYLVFAVNEATNESGYVEFEVS